MSWKASGWAKTQQGISPREKLVLLVLADYVDESRGYAFPSLNRLADESLTSLRHVQRILRSLEKKGKVRIERVSGAGSRYFLLDTPDTMSPLTSDVTPPLTQLCHPSRQITGTDDDPPAKPSDIFRAIDGINRQMAVINLDQYDAAFNGTVSDLRPVALNEMITQFDDMRRRHAHHVSNVTPTPIIVPGIGLLRALQPVADYIYENKVGSGTLWDTMSERLWGQLTADGNNVLLVIAKEPARFLGCLTE